MSDLHELKLSHDGPKTWFPINNNNNTASSLSQANTIHHYLHNQQNQHQPSISSSISPLPLQPSTLPPPLPRLSTSSSSLLATPSAIHHHNVHDGDNIDNYNSLRVTSTYY